MDKTTKPATDYRGVNIDKADDNKVDAKLVEQATRELNNNPRNNNLDE